MTGQVRPVIAARGPGDTPQDSSPDANVSPRRLVFVNRLADAGPSDASTDIVVLDTAWTPGPDERADLIPIRPIVRDVLDRHNLFDESLERIDAWADEAGAADVFLAGGVTWWFHARSFLRLDLHEMMLWAHVLARLAPPGRYERFEMPGARDALVRAARAPRPSSATPTIVTHGPAAIRRSGNQGRVANLLSRDHPVVGRIRRPAGHVLRRMGLRQDLAPRMAFLEARLRALAAEPGAVLAVVRSASFHVIHGAGGQRRGDPYVTPVLDALTNRGQPVVTVAIALGIRRDEDWDLIERDERMLPMSFINRRSTPPPDDRAVASEVAARIAAIPDIPLDVEGFDLGPALRSLVTDLGPWFERQRHGMLAAERILLELRPSTLFTGWEGARTMWLAAARRLAIPSLAVQHGVIYPNNPDYYRPLHDGLVRPDVTCVYGPYERDLLVRGGRYAPSTVVVTGSPRVDPDGALRPSAPDERDEVRRELGIEDGDRLLVVSAARNPVGDEIHSVSMVARVLDGPLPGIHVVFKLHPEEPSGEHYEALLAGLARAGDYPPIRVSVVRDVDLYRLLRAADAHLGQYSTVLTDAVLTGTPNMIAVGQAYGDIIGYVDAGVAVPVRSVDDVRTFMADPRPATHEDRARFLEQHYQKGDATRLIAAAITDQIAPSPVGADR